jgi:transcriptional regulator with XRE-family HTH domain
MDDWTEATTFGGLLKEYRYAIGWTQAELARRSGLSVRGIQHLERGETRPYRHTHEQLAAALGLSSEQRARFAALALPTPRRRPPGRSVAADAPAEERAPGQEDDGLADQTARLLALARWGQSLLSEVSAILARQGLLAQPQTPHSSWSGSAVPPSAPSLIGAAGRPRRSGGVRNLRRSARH